MFNERDLDAIEWIGRNYFSQVYVIARRLANDGPEADDLVQETFMKLLLHKKPFDDLRGLDFSVYHGKEFIPGQPA